MLIKYIYNVYIIIFYIIVLLVTTGAAIAQSV